MTKLSLRDKKIPYCESYQVAVTLYSIKISIARNMKKLIIVSHPNIESSVINKRWVNELEKHPDHFTIHNIYTEYPDGKIDIEKEQKLIEAHDALILQYPLYWFNCPPFLKQWLDDVFTYGWAYGSKGNMMKGRKIALAISAGIDKEDFQEDGEWKVTIEQLTLPYLLKRQHSIPSQITKGISFYMTLTMPPIRMLWKKVQKIILSLQ